MNGQPSLTLGVWCCLSAERPLRTWRRTALWWAGWRRGGPVQHRRTAAARQWGSPTVWWQESADCSRNSGRGALSCTYARFKNPQRLENTHQVQRQGLPAVGAQGQLQHLLGEGSQHQQRHQGQGDAEAQQGHEAALAARPPVTGAGHPARTGTRQALLLAAF